MTKEVNLTIDGKRVSVPEGTLIVDAAKKIGIDIPVFCYHPKMEPVGMCRMCLVDVGRPAFDRETGEAILDEDGSPKIQFGWKLDTACTVPVSEGMVVEGMTEKVQKGRQDIVELLLTSHPLDCPICDKGGECPLQNLTMAHGAGESRFIYDDKIHFDKNVPLGDLIWLDRERCIQCARCIRFQEEIVDDAVLEFFNRGRATDIITNSEPGFDSYWSGNTTDICPVGALTTADFRFGARPWELKHAASVCSHCPVGCNMTYNTRREAKSGGGIVIKRAMPRQNESVNELWICDKGRFAYHFTESEERLTQPMIRKGGKLVPTSWDDALALVAGQFKDAGDSLLSLVSGRLPNEDLFNIKKLTAGLGGKAGLHSYMAGGDLVAQVGLSTGSNLGDLGEGDTIVVIACDLEEEAPVWWLRIKAAAERGAKLIVANPRITKLDRYATEIIRYAYGEEVKTVTNVNISDAENALVFYGSEGIGLETSQALANACANLLAKTNHVGKPNNGLVAVWPRANTQGAWDMGYRPGADLAKAKVLYIAGSDPVGDDPSVAEVITKAEFVVVQELFLTKTAELADVVLPVQAQTEREGTFTSGERRVQRFYPVVLPKGETRPDFDIAAQISAKVGVELKGRFPSLVLPQISAEIPGYAGITYQKLAEVSEQWPIVGRGDLYYGGTGYENKQGLGMQLPLQGNYKTSEVLKNFGSLPDAEVIAVPITQLYDRGTMISPSEVLHPRLPEPFILVNPKDSQILKTTDGMVVGISINGRDTSNATVVEDEHVPQGIALVPRSMGIPIDGPSKFEIRIAVAAMA
ncbi:MAG: NADH-quinone oxidoreductase subunit NuoG [Anaerolineales bacterium]|nr:NADH-quinone oxidoreductase subunit NuoG [Chloroflexota bacterium]MBL6980405.1 NADH-quinone oxidoreductase subunit NuoG [Anaerolineales bacterium]